MVKKRKTLEEAMVARQEAFVKTGKAVEEEASPVRNEKHQQSPGTNVTPAHTALQEALHTVLPPLKFSDAGLSGLNVRIDPAVLGALVRAAMVRKLHHQKPFTQREIVSEALGTWLKTHGYL